MKLCWIAFFLLSPIVLLAQQKTWPVYYDVDRYQLTTQHQASIDSFLQTIPSKAITTIVLRGHTDTTASIAYNQWLSQQRAQGVQQYLLQLGIPKEKIQLDAFGETQAQSPANLIADRRVDVILYYNPPPPPIIEAVPDPIVEDTNTVVELYRLLSPPPQEFCIAPDKDTVIYGEKGTIVVIKAHSFQLQGQSISPSNCITIQLKECFLKSEMLMENVNTITEAGEILETQGMVYTNALLQGDTLDLVKDIVIMQPTDKIVEGVKVLDGQRDPHTDAVNWTLNNNSVLRNFDLAQVEHCVTYNNMVYELMYCDEVAALYQIAIDSINSDLNYQYLFNNCRSKLGPIHDGCPCCLFFCGFNEAFLWIATRFDKQMREIEPYILGCYRGRLGRTIQAKRALNGRPIRTRVFVNLRNTILRQRKRRAKKSRPQSPEQIKQDSLRRAEEERLLQLTDAILEGDAKVRRGLRGLNKETLVARCNELDSLFTAYGVATTEGLVYALNQPLMKEFGVTTMEELLDTLPKANLSYLEVAYKNKKISYEDYKFYVFNSSSMGWKNLDIFADIPQSARITMKVNLVPSTNVDCKLIFQQRQFVLPGKVASQHFYFEGIPKKENAWIVALNYKNGRPLLAMKKIMTAATAFEVEFKEYSLEELREQLKILDFEG